MIAARSRRAADPVTATGGEWPANELEEVSACPVCGSHARQVLHSGLSDLQFLCAPGTWTFHSCLHCSSAYLDPRPTPESIGRAYTSYYTHGSAGTALGLLGRLQRRVRYGFLNDAHGYDLSPAWSATTWLTRLLPRERSVALKEIRHLTKRRDGMRVLDVGCGSGAFLDFMRWQGWSVHGLEPDQAAVDTARQRGLDVQQGTVDRLGDLPDASFDAITMSHVIEHLHDPVACLRACVRLLAPDGVMYIATPNLQARSHAIFGRHWIGLDAPRHLVLFNWASLEGATTAAGLGIFATVRGSWDETWIDVNSRLVRDRWRGGSGDVQAGLQLRARLTNWWGWARPRRSSEIAVLCQHANAENRKGSCRSDHLAANAPDQH